MNLHWIDWSIVLGLLVFITVMAIFTKKYTQSVADFLAANRCAGRYLISVSQGIAGVGAISLVAGFEMFYNAGFTAAWWKLIWTVVTTIVFLSGWVYYRYRQTRVFTLPQFFEVRYSKRFRIFAGFVAFLGGIVNFSIFPAVGARFFIHFCDFPNTITVYALIMAVLLAFALFFTFLGGQIAVIVTDFFQGLFCNIMFIVIIIAVLTMFTWPQITEALFTAPDEASLVHPFHTEEAEGFNIWFFLILAFGTFYRAGSWQGSQGYNVSAINAHEARMGKILSTWRILALDLFMMVLPICAFTFMHHPDFAASVESIKTAIGHIANPTIQTQMMTPIIMRHFLPTGIMGGLIAVMLAAFISTHDTYMHSWGSMFIQDVVMPFRKKPFTRQQHMNLLRYSITGVAVFIFMFSLLFRQTEYIYMFMEITGAIFAGGAGSAIVGGLYWKRGTTAAAWGAMFAGLTVAVSGIIIRQIHARSPFTGQVMEFLASKNGVVWSFWAAVLAIIIYILVSLLGKRSIFDLDKMLHRGKYAIDEQVSASSDSPVRGFRALIGMGSEFNFRDKIVYLSTIGWTFLQIAIFTIVTIYNFAVDVKVEWWATFWRYYIWVVLTLAILTTIWFTIGGWCDFKRMFALLGKIKKNDLDDGMVVDHHNMDEDVSKNEQQE